MALSSSPEQPQPLRTVVAATKEWVERLNPIWVEGQLIEIKRRSGITQFLTMRDTLAEVSVTLSTSLAVLDAAGPITEGTVVAAWVKPTVWSKSGSLTFECRELRPSGEGRLLAAIEQRKRMLQAEGLFDPARKQRLPFLPRRIGLITGAASAAERDVIENIARRWPAAIVEVRNTLVQGPAAVEQLIDALHALDAHPEVDVIIVARGGGSLEDLLAFSDESLARAVFACNTPVVSAIGHETDTPILDLVADLRASTPTDAAKRVVPDAAAEGANVAAAIGRVRQAVSTRVASEQRRLEELRSRPVLLDPSASLTGHFERLEATRERLVRAIGGRVREEHLGLAHTIERVRALSPRATLQRGYAILSDAEGGTVDRVAATAKGAKLTARLADGQLGISVTKIEPVEQP
ncbi:exodeoxyribonuclease VII large subunit [Propionicimonas sp.]|uniref:exodeoxyribonuclease VII large subunit n=1 Tax=Propionicimonas sp. TaxID=1955623 RepID=UPI0017FE96DB|nr:exodeoxyribonuclease VII large subunit [Propionicimonas sp.]MBU3978027.1 exodeoxyribonuclease VII large subunit [Actinomycetota bacterium]MBA3021751.1 exodeoxyribonuclease VII large subunit [Propionicimonas sp.]MBU3985471.1 exodeoxyribonuclease VII large subunit [Actinomycetota bacterium]MBU4007566.1 exodeoxyribonuclease VII large subunit [Actinomycetota bacterium]MBU4066540.1 exodeoxyribonuclease VII large subunit [Actinomycetota bacterium]